jgi:hypothetical protein
MRGLRLREEHQGVRRGSEETESLVGVGLGLEVVDASCNLSMFLTMYINRYLLGIGLV